MTSIQTPHAWQLTAVSRMGRLTVAALCSVALCSVIARGSFSTAIVVAALAIVPLLVAIRVARGFEGSLAGAITTCAGAATVALPVLNRGVTASAVSLLTTSLIGLVAAVVDLRQQSRRPTIELTRTDRDGPQPVVARR
jgi:hypothetical protein